MKPSEGELPLNEVDDPFADAWAPGLQEAAEDERKAKIDDDVRTAFSGGGAPASTPRCYKIDALHDASARAVARAPRKDDGRDLQCGQCPA